MAKCETSGHRFWQPNSRHSDDGDVESKLRRSKAPHSWEILGECAQFKVSLLLRWVTPASASYLLACRVPGQAMTSHRTVAMIWRFQCFKSEGSTGSPSWLCCMISYGFQSSRYFQIQETPETDRERERGVLSLADAIFEACRDQCNLDFCWFNCSLLIWNWCWLPGWISVGSCGILPPPCFKMTLLISVEHCWTMITN